MLFLEGNFVLHYLGYIILTLVVSQLNIIKRVIWSNPKTLTVEESLPPKSLSLIHSANYKHTQTTIFNNLHL